LRLCGRSCAVAWVSRNPVVSAPITGARKPAHLDDAIASLDIVLTQDEVAQLEAPYTPHPVAGLSEHPSPQANLGGF
jgi:1-deoxyxylulose-5-phosphate synthase